MNTRILYSTIASLAIVAAFDNTTGWKKDASGNLEKDANGNPIYVDGSGRELTVEPTTISRLNGEAKTHRERAEKAESKLKEYEGLDPAAARTALETLSKVDQKKLIEAGEVDKVKSEISKQYETQLQALNAEKEKLASSLNNLRLSTAFKGSQFLKDRVAVPSDMFEAAFSNRFKVEGDKITPLGDDGSPLLSQRRIGEYADFEEALEILVNKHPAKEQILRAPNAGGSGSNGNGGNRPGGRVVSRADFDKLPPMQQAEIAGKARTGEITIAD